MTTHHSAETASTPHPHGFATKPRAMTSERTRIKICGLTREQDVDAAVAAGADAVGFVLYAPSPRAVTPERAAQLARRLPPFVTPVLLFVNESATNIAAASAMVAGAIVQFHGDETPADCLLATGHGLRPFLRAARIPLGDGAERFDLVKYAQDFFTRPGHPARRTCRRLWWWRQGIQLVTPSTKRQLSPRFVWWTHACKRDRWHFASPPARPLAGG